MAAEPGVSNNRLDRSATNTAAYNLYSRLHASAVGISGLRGPAIDDAWAVACLLAMRDVFILSLQGGQQDTDPSVLLMYHEHVNCSRPVPFLTIIRYLDVSARLWEIKQLHDVPFNESVATRVKVRLRDRDSTDFQDAHLARFNDNFEDQFRFITRNYKNDHLTGPEQCKLAGIKFFQPQL